MISIHNPTSRSKAVRDAGGLVVIKPNETAKVTGDWTEAERLRYEAAGLEPVAAKAKTKKRLGLETQATKANVPFDDDTTDDALIAAIKAAKDAK